MKLIYCPQARMIYSERSFKELKEKPQLDECIKLDMKIHSPNERIRSFRGYTPKFAFYESGFKNEGEIDLLDHLDYLETLTDGPFKGARIIKNTDKWTEARNIAGSIELLEVHKQELSDIYQRLNERNINFIVFRSYRSYPATWDKLYFFSQGSFK